MITQEELQQLLHYDPDTGLFTWKARRSGIKRLNAGCRKPDGYLCIRINNKLYLAHRLAWLYVYGKFPDLHLDHINRNPSDNRICNLRQVTQQQNMFNLSDSSNNALNLKGVYVHKGKYRAMIKLSKKIIHLGLFDDPDKAHKVYLQAKAKLHVI